MGKLLPGAIAKGGSKQLIVKLISYTAFMLDLQDLLSYILV